MTPNARALDQWIRSSFVQINTELEEMYFHQETRSQIVGTGSAQKQQILKEGHSHMQALLAEGNTDEGFDAGFDVLGNVGLYMGACRRHEIEWEARNKHSPLADASALALQLGASLGVTPRFATSHLSTHNRAQAGVYKTFTSLSAESTFLEFNTRGILAYKRAADALARILPMGVSHPVAYDLFTAAELALGDVWTYNKELFEILDVDRFFYCVRPYYKTHRVGLHEYRGANAGDFAGINQIDLLLGLCRADNSSYSQLLVDKFLFMMPEDQARLRDCMRRDSLLDSLLPYLDSASSAPWFKRNAGAFLRVCEAHGAAAAQHHDLLVDKFISAPAETLPVEHTTNLTASGPPLDVLLASLEKLRDLRLAADRDDIPSRHHDLAALREALK
jgi:hypothetical protein